MKILAKSVKRSRVNRKPLACKNEDCKETSPSNFIDKVYEIQRIQPQKGKKEQGSKWAEITMMLRFNENNNFEIKSPTRKSCLMVSMCKKMEKIWFQVIFKRWKNGNNICTLVLRNISKKKTSKERIQWTTIISSQGVEIYHM